ncbi:MAG TPA: restriction endonuclease [Bacillota bacterium]|nr:restriction endonuclease [Bacillota bacterium]
MKITRFPTYSQVTALLKIVPQFCGAELRNVFAAIKSLLGTPQNPVSWDDPDEWISSRLSDQDARVAEKVWNESNHLINPRYLKFVFGMVSKCGLVEEGMNGPIKLTVAGQDFLDNPSGNTWQLIDREEGLATALELVQAKGIGRLGELLPDWADYCLAKSNIRTERVMRYSLAARLKNLMDRGLVTREGIQYRITEDGERYLSLLSRKPKEEDYMYQLSKLMKTLRDKQKEALRAKLEVMDPHAFEKLVKELLEAMEYEDVQVTAPSGDKGVDVVGKVQVGITSVTEVIQVKRRKGNITRPVLDALRGSLHRFGAFRGTIITLSDFAKGAKESALEKGAAPITLINGDMLMDLMIEHEVGVKKQEVSYFVIDENFFDELEHEESDEEL